MRWLKRARPWDGGLQMMPPHPPKVMVLITHEAQGCRLKPITSKRDSI